MVPSILMEDTSMIIVKREVLEKLIENKKFLKKLEKCKTLKDLEKLLSEFSNMMLSLGGVGNVKKIKKHTCFNSR